MSQATAFCKISGRYEHDSVVQRMAADELLGLLQIGPREDVLDLGCGSGHITRHIRTLTQGRVHGVDPSPGMIAVALANSSGPDLTFEQVEAEEIGFRESFDVVFCNSSFHWFRDPSRALTACYDALRTGGRLGIQAPAKKDFCPNFIEAVAELDRHPLTGPIFQRFQSPWNFFETAETYAALVSQAGFDVKHAKLETSHSLHDPAEAMSIFESGAAAGYFSPKSYPDPIPEGFFDLARSIVAESLTRQSEPSGQVELVFHRVYLIATRNPR